MYGEYSIGSGNERWIKLKGMQFLGQLKDYMFFIKGCGAWR
jgi:hypothetical protein